MLEVCVDTINSCLEAKRGGADRLELCECISSGGLTPSYGKIIEARKIEGIKLNILIRPRVGGFTYSAEEISVMKNDIKVCSHLNCDGVVFGILTKDNKIDIASNEELVKIAQENNLSCTFHRAFDICDNLNIALENIISLGFDRILTSGGEETAMKSITKLKNLTNKAKEKIIIMPGSGINENNIETIIKEINPKELHGTFSELIKEEGDGKLSNYFGGNFGRKQTDWEIVKKVKSAMIQRL